MAHLEPVIAELHVCFSEENATVIMVDAYVESFGKIEEVDMVR